MSEVSRREFIGNGAKLAAGISIAPGMMLVAPAQAREAGVPADASQRWSMLIDTTKCVSGCDDCVSACQKEHAWGDNEPKSNTEQKVQWIRKVDLKNKTTGSEHSLPMMCQHCEKPPCVDVCPTGASMKRADGIVLVDKHICIGCRYCMMACPYKARSFIHESITGQSETAPRGKGTVEACTMCVHKLDAGENTTACAQSCKHGAIIVGDLNDANSEIAQRVAKYASTQIRADLGLNTGVRYQGI